MPNSMDDQLYNVGSSASVAGGSPETVSWTGLVGTIVVFLIILLVALWLIKKVNRFSVRNIESPWVRVLDRQVLQGQQVLYLVEIAGKIQVLGVTDHQITKVAEINDPETAAEILDEIAHRPQEKMDKLMTGIWTRVKKKDKNHAFSAELERLLEEVKK